MKYIEELLKKRFDNAHSTEGVNNDELWAAINESLPPVAPSQKPAAWWMSRRWLLALGLLVLVGSNYYWFSAQATQADTSISTKQTIHPAIATNQNQESNASTKETASLPQLDPSTQSATPPPTKPSEYNNTPAQEPILTTASSPTIDPTTTVIEHEINTADFHPTATVNNSARSNESSFYRQLPAERILFSTPTAFIHSPLPQSVLSNQQATVPLQPTVDKPNILASTPKPFQVGIFSGLNLWKNKFASGSSSPDHAERLTNASDYAIGHTFAFELDWNIGKNIHLTSGISYNQTHHQFNLEQSWDTLMFRDNIPGSDLINARATRTVKHYNSLNYYSIPVRIAVNKAIGKFELGASAGLAFNYISLQSGKSLNANGQVATYPNTETGLLPYSSFFLSYEILPFVNYQLADKVRLQLRPEFRYQHHGTSAFYGSKHSSYLLGLSLGGLYSL